MYFVPSIVGIFFICMNMVPWLFTLKYWSSALKLDLILCRQASGDKYNEWLVVLFWLVFVYILGTSASMVYFE